MPDAYICTACSHGCGVYTAPVDLDAEHGVGGEFESRRMGFTLASCCCGAPVESRRRRSQPYSEWADTAEGREYRADEAADRRRDRRITEGF